MIRTIRPATGHGSVKSECPECKRMVKAHFRLDASRVTAECDCGAVLVLVPPTGDWYLGTGAEAWRESA